MATSTSAADVDVDRVIGAVSPGRGESTQRAEQSSPPQAFEYRFGSPKIREVVLHPQPVEIIQVRAVVPTYVQDFAKRAARIHGVTCVVAETGEDPMSIHITTFAKGFSDEIRTQIYELESAVILENPHVAFDFHLRREEEATGSPTAMTGKYYYAVWEFPNADEGSAPKSGG